MTDQSDTARLLLIDTIMRHAHDLGITLSQPEIERRIGKLSDYEVDQIWAEAFYYYRHEKDQRHEETASQRMARRCFYDTFDRLHL